LKNFVFILFFVFTGIQFFLVDINIIALAFFFLNYLLLMVIMYYHFFLEKEYSPFISAYLIFSLLFFVIAPLAQISKIDTVLPRYLNYLPYHWKQTIFANLCILIFNVVFFISYVFFKKYNNKVKPYKIRKRLPFDILVILVICVLILIFNIDFIQQKLMTPNWKLQLDKAKSIKIIISKVLFSIPLAGIAMCVMYFKKKNNKPINWVVILGSLIIFLLLILIFKNPFMEKRSGLGPIYFSLLFLFVPKLLNNNIKTTLILYLSLIIAMPILAVFTHINSSFIEVLKNPKIITGSLNKDVLLSNFNTLHFDAYANFLATIENVSFHGFSMGEQLSSALFFSVPRSIWPSKPLTSGQFLGNYLIEEHGFYFNNISNPFVSEAYLNFGVIGIVIFAIILAYFLTRALVFLKSDDYLKKVLAFFIAIHMIYFLRGDFTNGFSQLILVSFGIYVIPKSIKYFYQGTKLW
jgi:hypothetical protein